MIYSVSGRLIHTDPQTAVVECGGVGMKCTVSLRTLQSLPPLGAQATLFTHLNVREDALDLYGFADAEELGLFRMLIEVSGVGPKVALAILSEFSPDRLCLFIAGGDAKSITRAAGVGAKLAQRLVLELKDKIGAFAPAAAEEDVRAAGQASASSAAAEAVEALVSLGYSQGEASLAVGRLDGDQPVEALIKSALKSLSRM